MVYKSRADSGSFVLRGIAPHRRSRTQIRRTSVPQGETHHGKQFSHRTSSGKHGGNRRISRVHGVAGRCCRHHLPSRRRQPAENHVVLPVSGWHSSGMDGYATARRVRQHGGSAQAREQCGVPRLWPRAPGQILHRSCSLTGSPLSRRWRRTDPAPPLFADSDCVSVGGLGLRLPRSPSRKPRSEWPSFS